MPHSLPRSGALLILTVLLPASFALATASPQEERHELMEGVGDGAKAVGSMLEGERPFDAAAALEALQTWDHASAVFGDLFPAGSDSEDDRALPAIWTERAGFDSALQEWAEAVDAAVAANPQTLEELQAAAGPVFKKCKACHEHYRAEED
jgi:cytochrome c556